MKTGVSLVARRGGGRSERILSLMFYQEIGNRLILSLRRKPWFDEPFDRITVLSRVEGLTTLSIAEGESSVALMFWTPAFAGVTNT